MAVSGGPDIVEDGLVLALDAANPKSYPGSGTTWTDLSGNSNNCVFSNSPTWANGSFTFNGTTNVGTITNNASLDFSTEQTVIMALKPTATSGRRNPWNQRYGGYGTWTWEGSTTGNPINHYFGDAGADTTPYVGRTTGNVSQNVYSIVTTVRDVNQSFWGINKTISTPTAHTYGTLLTTTADILIGNGYAGYFQGQIDFILAYTRALTVDEVLLNVSAIQSRFGIV